MKTASVADLRNNFATVSRWIYEGESVTIKKRGRAFAVLSPAEPRRNEKIAWPDFAARLQRVFPDGPTPSSEEVVNYLRGDY